MSRVGLFRILAALVLLVPALPVPGWAGEGQEAAGVIVRKTGTGEGGLRVGDRLFSWKQDSASGSFHDILDWMWFRARWAECGPSEIRLFRDGATVVLDLPTIETALDVVPSLPADLSQALFAFIKDTPSGQEWETSLRRLEERVEKAGGPEVLLWFQCSLARSLLRGSRWGDAVELVSRAIETAGRCPDRHAFLLASILKSKALLRAERPEEVVSNCSRLLDRIGKTEKEGLVRASILQTLGMALRRTGEIAEAGRALERALSIRSRLASGSLSESDSLRELGAVKTDQGEMKEGIRLIEKAIKIQLKMAPDSEALADSYNTLGGVLLITGRTEEARTAFDTSMRVRRRLPGEPGIFKVLYNLGLIAYQEQKLGEASRLLKQARLRLGNTADADMLGARVLDLEMAVAMMRGAFDEAERLGAEGLKLHRRLDPKSLPTAISLINLGALASRQGDINRARARYLEALEIVRESAPGGRELPAILVNLADLALSEGDYAGAVPSLKEALKTLVALQTPETGLAQVHQDLGFALLQLDRLEEATREAETALKMRQKTAPGSRDEALALHLLGRTQEERGETERAARSYGRAIAILRDRAPGTIFLGDAIHALALLQRSRGDREAAIRSLQEAIDNLEEQLQRLGGTESVRSAFRGRYASWYRELEDLLVESRREVEAFHYLERSRARSLLVMMAEARQLSGDESSHEYDLRRRKLASRYDATLAALATAPDSGVARLRDQLAAIRREQDDLRESIRRRSPRLASLRYPAPLRAAEATALVPSDGLALAYSVGEEHSRLYILSPDGSLRVKRIRTGRSELESMVSLYRGLLLQEAEGPDRLEALGRAEEVLSRLLIDPAAPFLSKAHTLLVLPDGPLNLLPFAALKLDSTRLCERFALAVEPSLSALALMKAGAPQEHEAPGKFVAFASPTDLAAGTSVRVLRGVDKGELAPIPETLREVRSLAGTWRGKSKVVTGKEASENTLLRLAPGASILHVAAHALVDGENPLDSAIVLSPDPKPEESNGLLQAWEIIGTLRLPGALVTLSGCETALGREREGEGLIGLTRAFQFAGARSVVSSLWRVDDRATALLMEAFYGHLEAGLPVAEALRRAQLDLLHREVPKPGLLLRVGRFLGLVSPEEPLLLSDPTAWAAFQVQGDPQLVFP